MLQPGSVGVRVQTIVRATSPSERVRANSTWLLLALLLLVALTGGGSRADIESLPFLRFLSAALIALAVLVIRRDELSRIRIPLALLGAIAVVALLQLIPLPPSVWSELPGRDVITTIDALLALDVWRPITVSPAATINTLGSLTVPLAALLLFGMSKDRPLALLGFVAIGLISASLGILQLFADPRSGLFLYEITNNGSAVGLFANRNHHAVFLACCLLIGLFLLRHGDIERFPWMRPAMAGSVLFLGLAIVANASRAGLISLILALALGAAEALLVRSRGADRGSKRSHSRHIPIALITAGVMVLTLFIAAERSPALSRILENSALEDLRAKLLPVLIDMAADYQPWGTGLGAFEHAYRMREPAELLQPGYVNEAHNDWLQFAIEAGAPGLAILLAGLLFLIVRSINLVKNPAERPDALLGFGIILVLGAASVVDYPLRVPSVMALAAIALALLALPAVRGKAS